VHTGQKERTEYDNHWFYPQEAILMGSSRRQFIRETAASILGTVTPLSSVVSDVFGDTDNRQQVPNQATSSEVYPLSPSRVGVQIVPEEDWIMHHFGWETAPNEPKSGLRDMLDVASCDFEIDGISIDDQSNYWSGIRRTEDGLWSAGWDFPVPPRPPGAYEFSMTITFDEPILSKQSDGGYREWAGTYHHQGAYYVREETYDETCVRLPDECHDT
jgi:hypothetical protein